MVTPFPTGAPHRSNDADFDWVGSTTRTSVANTKETREDEITNRAYLMARLGYPKKLAETRLKQNLTWEYENLGKAAVTKRVSALVAAAYKRAGPGKKV